MARLKKEDIAQMSTEEIVADVAERRKLLAEKRFFNGVTPLENTNELGEERKNIARLLTELREREMADAAKTGEE